MQKRKLVLLLALFALVPFALAACGGDDDDEPAPEPEVEAPAPETDGAETDGAETVQVSAEPGGELAFQEDSLEASAGEVTFEFENPAALGHDFVLEDQNGNEIARTDVISNDTDSFAVDLEPGEYTFFCSVPGHRPGGMEGPLTVE